MVVREAFVDFLTSLSLATAVARGVSFQVSHWKPSLGKIQQIITPKKPLEESGGCFWGSCFPFSSLEAAKEGYRCQLAASRCQE